MRFMTLFFLLSVCMSAQNMIVVDEKNETSMAIGIGDRSIFADSNFAQWFNNEYTGYKVKGLDDFSNELEDINITIVLGTWCGDSKREVPRFLKILDELNFPNEMIKMIFVDRKKIGLENEVEELNIEYVPTFIFYRGKNEIGRIVEAPEETLEEDLKSIIE